ncbi:anaerobic ribonucleoside-triphosphate reductase activating protein [Clostridium botulinum]
MNYSEMLEYDIANAPYVCTTLFVSGCTHKCEGCFNKVAQDFNYGHKWTQEEEDQFLRYANNSNVKGINILGGEPMQQDMGIMLHLLERLKRESRKPIWLWTGYFYDDIIKNKSKKQLLKYIDVLIDGKFQINKRSLKLNFRGSSNQRVIDVQKSLKQNKVVLWQRNC